MRAFVIGLLTFILYNIIAFVIPFEHSTVFWLSYAFTLTAFVVAGVSMYIAFFKNADAKSRFFGLPVAKIGAIYAIVQFVVSLVIMALGELIIWWIPFVVYAVGLCLALIGLIATEATAREILAQDEKVIRDTTLMRSLQSKVESLANLSGDSDLKKLAEEFRYSDPVSSERISDSETELAVAVSQLQTAYEQGNAEALKQMCGIVAAKLSERNRLCRLTKK